MKILYHHRIGSKDGQFVHIEELVAAFRTQGHEVLLVGPSGFEDQPFGGESGLVARLKQLIPAACYELLEFGYNVVDYARLARATRRFRPDIIYERNNLYLVSGLMAQRRFGIPLLLEVNAPLCDERSEFGGLKLPGLARWLERKVWTGSDHVFTVTHVLAQRLFDAGVAPVDVTVTPNGINRERFPREVDRVAAKQRLGLEGRVVLGFVGFAREWHGLDTVVRMLSSYAGSFDLHFLLVGDGPARPLLESLAGELGVEDRMTITGIVDREQIAGFVSAFDVALQPSVVAYASPLKLFEYMACGNAIVAPDTDNIREIVTHDEDALLIEPGRTDSFENAVRRLIEDADGRERLGRAARQTLDKKELTWEHNAREVNGVAERLVRAQA